MTVTRLEGVTNASPSWVVVASRVFDQDYDRSHRFERETVKINTEIQIIDIKDAVTAFSGHAKHGVVK